MSLDLESFSRFSRKYKAGEIIFSEFEPGNTVYLLKSGKVKLIKNTGEFERTLDILLPTEMFGEMAILENSPRTATAVAMEDVIVLEFSAQNFDILLNGNPQIAFKLLKIFTKRIYDSKRRFMILKLPDPHAKVADVFLMLDETQPSSNTVEDDNKSRKFYTSIDDIANWAGMSADQTRDILIRFANQRRVELFKDHIIVKNISDFSRFVNAQRNQT